MTRRQRFTLVAAILGSSVAAIDGTIVNVALPAIQKKGYRPSSSRMTVRECGAALALRPEGRG